MPVYVWGDGRLRLDNAGRSMQLTATQQRAGDVAVTMEVVALPAEVDTITTHSPTLLTRCGIGPDTVAALLIAAGDNPDRLRSEASFATLCGVSPLQASSGKTTRHRLNRGGERQANAALYRIAMSRLRWVDRTGDYLHRRITEGKPTAKQSAA